MESSDHASLTSSSPRQPVSRIFALHLNLRMYQRSLPDNGLVTTHLLHKLLTWLQILADAQIQEVSQITPSVKRLRLHVVSRAYHMLRSMPLCV